MTPLFPPALTRRQFPYGSAAAIEGIFLGLMTACHVTIPTAGTLRLVSKQGAPPTTIQFDPSLLKPSIDTVALDNKRLGAHSGATVYRIRLQRQTPAASGKLRLTILST